MSPQVIYTHGGGRLGNQVLRFVHWIAWAREYAGEVEVLNFAFWPFAGYFETWSVHPGCNFPIRRGRADRIATRWAAIPHWLREALNKQSRPRRVVQAAGHCWPGWQAVELDIAREESLTLDAQFLMRIQRRAKTMCCGWKIANWNLVAKHESFLRQIFRPKSKLSALAQEFVSNLRTRYDLVIGVFIRQSDYRAWYNGRFFFSATQYAAWMRQLLQLHGGKRVTFLIASEVWLDPAFFDELPVHFASGTPNAGGHWFGSWVELSLCDCIVSPPSTFSATAAFVGRISLWPVVSAQQTMLFDQIMNNDLLDAAKHPAFSLSVK
jgi:hypothetical protein